MKKTLFVVLFSCMACFVCLAQEDITITTYYPSPDGVYQTLETDSLTVHNNADIEGNLDVDGNADVGGNLDVIGTADANIISIANGAFTLATQGASRLNIRGGDVYFQNGGGTPAIIHTGEVWYCSSY